MKTREIAEEFGVRTSTVRRWRDKGCPATVEHRRYGWDLEAVRAWYAQTVARELPHTTFLERGLHDAYVRPVGWAAKLGPCKACEVLPCVTPKSLRLGVFVRARRIGREHVRVQLRCGACAAILGTLSERRVPRDDLERLPWRWGEPKPAPLPGPRPEIAGVAPPAGSAGA